jgi:hypothetical protein
MSANALMTHHHNKRPSPKCEEALSELASIGSKGGQCNEQACSYGAPQRNESTFHGFHHISVTPKHRNVLTTELAYNGII